MLREVRDTMLRRPRKTMMPKSFSCGTYVDAGMSAVTEILQQHVRHVIYTTLRYDETGANTNCIGRPVGYVSAPRAQ